MSDEIIICGAGKVGKSLGALLRARSYNVLYLEDYTLLDNGSNLVFLTMPPRIIFKSIPLISTLSHLFVETSSVKGNLWTSKPSNLILAHPLTGEVAVKTHWLLSDLDERLTSKLNAISQTYELYDMRSHDLEFAYSSHVLRILSEIIADAPGSGGRMKKIMSSWAHDQPELWNDINHLNRTEIIKALVYFEGQIRARRFRLENDNDLFDETM